MDIGRAGAAPCAGDPGARRSAPTIPTRARTLAVLGGYLQGRGDYAAAEPFFRRALEVRERLLGAEHPLTLGTLSDVAYLAKELDRLDEAENLSRRVLQVRERTRRPRDAGDRPAR